MSIVYRVNGDVPPSSLNRLREKYWPGAGPVEWEAMRPHSLLWVCAYDGAELIGFVNVVGDGGSHAFILDTIVASDYRGQGVGTTLVNTAAEEARKRDVEWLHVDYGTELQPFYAGCGFRPTAAGLRRLV